MRIPALLTLAATAVVILHLTHATAGAQEGSDAPIDSVRSVVITSPDPGIASIVYTVGVTPLPHEGINAALEANGLGGAWLSEDALGGFAYLGVGTRGNIGRLTFGAEANHIPENGDRRDGFDVRYSAWSMGVSFGYELLDDQQFALHPYVGLATRFNSLSIVEGSPTSLGQMLDSGGGRSISLSAENGYIEAGLGAEMAFPVRENEAMRTDLTVGLRAAFIGGFETRGWRASGYTGEISGGPDLNYTGLQLGLTIGFRFRPRVYDARIIAERDTLAAARPSVHDAGRGEAEALAAADSSAYPRITYGLRGGWNIARVHDDSDYDRGSGVSSGPLSAWQAGVFVDLPLVGMLSVQPEVLYSVKGGELLESPLSQAMRGVPFDSTHFRTTRYRIGYLELPVTARLRMPLGRSFALTTGVGFYLATPLSATLEYIRDYPSISGSINRPAFRRTTTADADIESLELGGVVAAGIEVVAWSTHLTLDMRVAYAFDDANASGPPIRNTVASVVAGVGF